MNDITSRENARYESILRANLAASAELVLRDVIEANRLVVKHEEGREETITHVEVNPAGELVIWIE